MRLKKSSGKRNAAKFLNTSIDTLNKYVNNLESELGVKLVASDEKGCTLTPKGEKVVAIADVLKQHLQQAYAIVPSETNVKERCVLHMSATRAAICMSA